MGGPILPLLVRTRIVLYIDPLLVAKGAALAAGSFSMPYVDVDQDRSMWCWAAVTEGIARSYDNASPWRQCTIAHELLGPLDCCGGPPGDIHPCNVQWELPEPLGKVATILAA